MFSSVDTGQGTELRRLGLCIVAALLVGAEPALAQASSTASEISGRVSQVADSSLAVAGASLEIVSTGVRTFSNGAGRFIFTEVPPGDQEIRVRAVGYQPASLRITVVAGRPSQQDIGLKRLPQALTEVRIEGRLLKVPVRFEEVYKRASRGVGKFFTRDDIEKLDPSEVKSLLNLVPTVQANDRGVTFARCLGSIPSEISPKKNNVRERLAKVQVYIDGVRVTNYGGDDSLTLVNQLSDVLRSVHARDIQIMEVYTGLSRIPPEFSFDACAVVAIWTK